MADAESLSLVYMRGHPADAARVLERIEASEAGALLERVPARIAAPVLAAMLPTAAARSLEALGDEAVLAMLGELGTQPVVSVLRNLPEPRRARLIDGLPTVAALASKLLMGYVEDSVGAWTDPDVLALPGATGAADALERMRHVEATLQRVFVVDANGVLEGWVTLSILLRAPAGASLASIMSVPEAVLPAQTPLAGALTHPGWALASLLPVVESGGRLVGALTRDALARALDRSARVSRIAPVNTLAGIFSRGYWDAMSGGVEAMVILLPAVPPVAGRTDG